jgi:O-antigen/teichoic acid export membrane protein
MLPWASLLNAPPELAADARVTGVLLLTAFGVGLPLSIVGRVEAGRQNTHIANLWAVVGSVAAVAFIVIGLNAHWSLPLIALGLVAGPLVAAFCNLADLFGRRARWLAPSLRAFDFAVTRSLLGTGLLFLTVQIAGAIAFQADNIVIAQVMSPADVPQYAVPAKIFMLGPAVLAPFLAPLWPAYADAWTRGDRTRVRRTFRTSVVASLFVLALFAALLLAVGGTLIPMWAGDVIRPSSLLLVGLAIWTMMNAVNGPIAALLLGIGSLRFMAGTSALMAIANICASVYLVRAIGVSGAVFGSIVSQVVFVIAPSAVMIYRLMRDNR